MGNLMAFQTHKWFSEYSKSQILDAIAFQNQYNKQLWSYQYKLKKQYEKVLSNRAKITNNFNQYFKEWESQNIQKVETLNEIKSFCKFVTKNKDKIDHECFMRINTAYFDEYQPKFINPKIYLAISKYSIGKKAQMSHQKQKICKQFKIKVEQFDQEIILHKNKIKNILFQQFNNLLQKFKEYAQKQIKDLLKKMQMLQNILNDYNKNNFIANINIFDQNGSFLDKYSEKGITNTCTNSTQ